LHALKSNDDPHGEIVRLEEHIDELAAKMESCRKFILVSRIATAGGGFVLAAMLLGAIRLSRRNGGGGRGVTRRHCRVGFKRQHRKGSSERVGDG